MSSPELVTALASFTYDEKRVPLTINKTTVDVVANLGQRMLVALARPDDLREQDENARVMEQEMMNQLTINIKARGVLESLPLCAATARGVEIVSGHHRVRGAKAAGLKEVPILLDCSGLSRSAIVSKQLAHNNIAGFDDQDIVRRLAKQITEVDDMLAAYLPKTLNVEPAPVDLDKLLAPRVTFDWKTVTFVFLPHQFTAFQQLADTVAGSHDLLGAAALEQFKPFADAMSKYGRFKNVLAIGMAIAVLTALAQRDIANGLNLEDLMNEDGEPMRKGWVDVEFLLGSAQVSPEAAIVIKKALDRMLATGTVGKKNLWQALELWAADYLASSKSGGVA